MTYYNIRRKGSTRKTGRNVGGRKLFVKSFLPPNPHLSKTFSSFGEGLQYIQSKPCEKKELILSFRGVTAASF
jgi:hypothetical protein